MRTRVSVGNKQRWLSTGSFILAVISVLALIAYANVRWADTRVLNTDHWVAIVAPLPKDPVIAAALGQYTVNRILNQTDAEQRIKDALPPKADFLAAPIYDQVQSRANKLATDFIISDQFQGIWTGANRIAVSTLLTAARDQQPPAAPKQQTKLQLGLGALRKALVDRVGTISSGNASSDVSVSLKTSINHFNTFVRTADFLNRILPYLTLAAILGSLAMARRRARTLVIIFGSTAVVSLILLISLKVSKNAVLGQVKHQVYKPAVGRIFDKLSASYKAVIINLLIVSLAIIALVALNKFVVPKLNLPKNFAARYTHWLPGARRDLQKYFAYILGGFTVLVLLYLAFAVSNIDSAHIINSVLLISIVASALVLLKLPPTPAPVRRKTSKKR